MSDISMMGAFSGVDMAMINSMIEAEAAKGKRFTAQKQEYTTSQNAWKDMNTRLDNLYNRLDDLQKPDAFNSKAVSMTGPENVKVTTTASAATGDYQLQVDRLATQTRLTGDQVGVTGDIRTELGHTGTLTVNGVDIAVEATDSLLAINEKINGSSDDTGVRSNIVDNRLVLTHTEYGANDITVAGDVVGDLGLAGITADTGQTSQFSIDGLVIERSSNTVDDVIDGVTFDLTNVHAEGETTRVSVTEDLDKAAETLEKFVEQYNSTQGFITTQLSVGDPSVSGNKTGTLSGDGTLMRLQSSLRSMVTSRETHGTSLNGLQALGVTVDRSGVASFDREVLETQVKEKPNEVKDFFSSSTTIPGEAGAEDSVERNGFSTDMRSLVNQYISSSNGVIKTRQDTYDRMIRDVNDRIDRFDERLEMRKERYIRQFSALDTAMMQAESQMNTMLGQLGGNQGG